MMVSMFKAVLNEQLKLYSSLYSNKETSDTLNNNLFYTFFPTDNDILKLNEDEKEYCEGMILEEECVKVIKHSKMENLQAQMDYLLSSITFSGTILKT